MPRLTRPLRKLILLTLVKESYLFSRNLYGFLVHPFLTAHKLKREKDYSQGLLLFGLPLGLWIGWVVILLLSRFFIFGRLQFGFLAKGSFLLISFFCALFFSYLLYYFWRTLKSFKTGGEASPERSGGNNKLFRRNTSGKPEVVGWVYKIFTIQKKESG